MCVVGRDGSIAVVECKLASNGDRRRMVIGQVIDYAAAISMAGADAFIESWLHNTQTDLRVELDSAALATLRTNISDGHVDLCLAVDKIDDHLRRLVEYLNRVTIAEVRVTALQLSYAKHGDVEILIPTTFGGEIADAKARRSGRSTRWTVETFLAALGADEDRAWHRTCSAGRERWSAWAPKTHFGSGTRLEAASTSSPMVCRSRQPG